MTSIRTVLIILLVLQILVIYTIINLLFSHPEESTLIISNSTQTNKSSKVVIGAVYCRLDKNDTFIEQTVVMIKSTIVSAKLYNISVIEIHLFLEHFSEDEPYFRREIFGKMAVGVNVEIILQVYSAMDIIPINYRFHMIYHERFRCDYVRFFFPEALRNVDSIIHLDSDMIVTGNIMKHWNLLYEMDDQQMLAMGNEMPIENVQGYTLYRKMFGRLPHVQPRGVNAGVVVMNLTKMRNFRLSDKLLQAYFDYCTIEAHMSGQRVFNILLYFNPGILKKMPCNLNFLESFCENGFYCNEALEDRDGIHLIHGTDSRFMEGGIFHPIYSLYRQLNISEFKTEDLVRDVMKPIKQAYSTTSNQTNQCFETLDKVLFKSFL